MAVPVLLDEDLTDYLNGYNADLAANWDLCLYKVDVDPNAGTTAAMLTECDYAGYAPIPLSGWGAAVLTGDEAAADLPEATFAFVGPGAGNNVFGYFWRHVVSGKARFGRRFDGAPLPMAVNGDKIHVDLTTFTPA